MSTTTTIPAGTKIYPYSTPEGIIQLVPLEALEQVIQERDNAAVRVAVLEERNVDLENQRDQARQQADAELVKRRNFFLAAQNADAEADQLRAEVEELRSQRDSFKAAVADLNQRLIERTRDMLAKQSELVQDARQARREARDAQAVVAAARSAIKAECLAQAVRRMEAVPVKELGAINLSAPGEFGESAEAVRARLIAAAKGEGQAVVVNEPPKSERQPDLSGESEKQAEAQPWTPAVGDVEANPVRPNAADSADNLRTEIEIGSNVVAMLKMPVPVKELAAIIDHVQVAYGPGLRIAEKPKGWLEFFTPTTPA